MSSSERPVGRRFSHVYLEPGAPISQSSRLQARVASFYQNKLSGGAYDVCAALNDELGADLYNNGFAVTVSQYIKKASPEEFIEAITVIASVFREMDKNLGRSTNSRLGLWVEFIDRAMREENFAFEVDQAGGIHPRVDPVFTFDRTAAVRGLNGARYGTAREHFETAHQSLGQVPPATNRAIRELFLANEEVFRMVCPTAKRLEGAEINSKLNTIIAARFDGPEREALIAMSRAALDYVSGSHQYRHAQGEPESPPASMQTATFIMSMGTGLLRWLIWLDQQAQRPSSVA